MISEKDKTFYIINLNSEIGLECETLGKSAFSFAFWRSLFTTQNHSIKWQNDENLVKRFKVRGRLSTNDMENIAGVSFF